MSPPFPLPTLMLLCPSSPPSLAPTTLLYTHQPPILHTPPRGLLDTHSTCTILQSLYPLSDFPTPPHPSTYDLISPLPHICYIPLHIIRILSEPHKSAPRHQDTEPPITKSLTCPLFNLQVSVPRSLFKFPPSKGFWTQSPFSQQVTAPALPSLESCLGCLLPETIPHPTFLLSLVLQPHGGHRATLSAIVLSSQEFCLTHTIPFSNCNRRGQQQHFHFLSYSTSLISAWHRPIFSALYRVLTPLPNR